MTKICAIINNKLFKIYAHASFIKKYLNSSIVMCYFFANKYKEISMKTHYIKTKQRLENSYINCEKTYRTYTTANVSWCPLICQDDFKQGARGNCGLV